MHQRGNPLVLSHNPPERWQKDIGETFYSMPMKSTDWIKQDYNAAFDFLLDNEADARSRPVLDTGQGVAVVLPTALPGLGVRFPGLFMAAPLIVFLCTLVAFPFVVLGSPLGWTVNALFVAALCLVLCLGLLLALKLMLGNRDLFPRASFATPSARRGSPCIIPAGSGPSRSRRRASPGTGWFAWKRVRHFIFRRCLRASAAPPSWK